MTTKFDLHRYVDAQLKAAGHRYDANETAAFSRELEYVFADVQRAVYPELKFRNVIPIISGAPLGATAHRWFEVDGFGEAKYLDNLATEDFPTAEIKGSEQTGKIRSMGSKYIVTVEELRAAALMRMKPDTEKAQLARRSIETLLDKSVWGGGPSTSFGGFKGLTHDDSSTVYSGTPANWFDESDITDGNPALIVADVRGMLEQAFLATKGAFNQFDLFLAPEIGVLLDRPMFFLDANDKATYLNQSIAQYMLQNLPLLRSITKDCFRLSAAGTGGKHRCLAYPRDPQVLDAFVPLDFEQFAPQLSGMAFVTHCHAKYGGIRIKHPLAVMRMDLATTASA